MYMKRTLSAIIIFLVTLPLFAQNGSADTIYVDVPVEVEVLKLQTSECISIGRKDIISRVDSVLCKIKKADQEVRADFARIVSGTASQEEMIGYVLKMEHTDSVNLAEVSNILDTYGWPKGLSEEANDAIFLVIDHSDLDTMKKYIGLFRKAAQEGCLPEGDLAVMEDRMLMYTGKPQKYGTQAQTVTENGQNVTYLWPVEDPDNLDKLRASVGLSPIGSYLEMVKLEGVEIIYDKSKTVKDFK